MPDPKTLSPADQKTVARLCLELVLSEKLEDPSGDPADIAYDLAIQHCADAIRKKFGLAIAAREGR